jgi:hypothetical protein
VHPPRIRQLLATLAACETLDRYDPLFVAVDRWVCACGIRRLAIHDPVEHVHCPHCQQSALLTRREPT